MSRFTTTLSTFNIKCRKFAQNVIKLAQGLQEACESHIFAKYKKKLKNRKIVLLSFCS